MLKKELIKRSPIRVLEKSIQGGLGKGNLGVFTARKGVGKTASLVHFAIDRLFHGQRVLHISFADEPQHIEHWYKQVFNEVATVNKLDIDSESFNEILPRRLILHFKQAEFDLELVKLSILRIINEGSFAPDLIIVDGYPLDEANGGFVKFWKTFAGEQNVEVWFSATLHREKLQLDENGIPAPVNKYVDMFSVIIMLEPTQNFVDLKLLKDHDSTNLEKLRLKLDPRTLLIANRRA